MKMSYGVGPTSWLAVAVRVVNCVGHSTVELAVSVTLIAVSGLTAACFVVCGFAGAVTLPTGIPGGGTGVGLDASVAELCAGLDVAASAGTAPVPKSPATIARTARARHVPPRLGRVPRRARGSAVVI